MQTITNKSFQINELIIETDNPKSFIWQDVFQVIKEKLSSCTNVSKDHKILKINLIKTTTSKLFFNVICLNDFDFFIKEPFIPLKGTFNESDNQITAMIIPTGTGASYGGYGGDANPIAKLIALTDKYFLTHPNVVNGAVLTDLPQNLIYLEGFLLDNFLTGQIELIPSNKNIIGVIFDKAIEEDRLDYEINVLNALRCFYGCEIKAWTVTKKPLNIQPAISKHGFSTGKINNLDTLIDEALKLKSIGVTAIAICSAIPDIELNKDYISGKGVDPIGGIEAIISHLISAVCGIVSANAPVLVNSENVNYKEISPLSGSEYIAKSFLPSVISGLRYAPIIQNSNSIQSDLISFRNLSKIIAPYNGFGSAGIFSLNDYFKGKDKILLIKENITCLDVNPFHLNTEFVVANTYKELISKENVEKLGIDSDVLKRPLEKIPNLSN